ncbi:ESX secretion-associated protein EspG [Saccharopolyspora taberi]|uniref:Uncharacterized protein n=1 Tax=Saccharopolyspora taberi TaxID=60895 RepID=A0ABN3V956_9PSEU
MRIDGIIDQPVSLDYAAFDVLYAAECGEDAPKPVGLEGISPGATYQERLRVVDEVLAGLHARGLAVVDTPVRPLLDTVRLLWEPHLAIYGWYTGGSGSGSFHIAASEDFAVFAGLAGDVVTLQPISWDSLYTKAFELVPEVGPVPGGSFVLPVRPASRHDSGSLLDPVYEEDDEDPVDREQARAQELVHGSRPLFAMQVFKASRTEFPLHCYAGENGAVLAVRKQPRPGADPRLHLIPATRGTFGREVRAL